MPQTPDEYADPDNAPPGLDTTKGTDTSPWSAPGGGNRPGAAGLPTVQTMLRVVSST